jgi:hypothetical protein
MSKGTAPVCDYRLASRAQARWAALNCWLRNDSHGRRSVTVICFRLPLRMPHETILTSSQDCICGSDWKERELLVEVRACVFVPGDQPVRPRCYGHTNFGRARLAAPPSGPPASPSRPRSRRKGSAPRSSRGGPSPRALRRSLRRGAACSPGWERRARGNRAAWRCAPTPTAARFVGFSRLLARNRARVVMGSTLGTAASPSRP